MQAASAPVEKAAAPVGAAGSGPGGAGGMTRPKVTAATGTTLVVVNPGVHHQTFEGWGTSLCWWANHVGGWSMANRNALVDKLTDATNGLGYNVFRYNIGGGDDPTHTHMGQYKNMPSFEPKSGSWDWDADANQRAILQRIVADNANAILEAFSNSPPYWMTKSGCASGNTDGSNNLNDSSYNAFADYLTEVVKHYKDTLRHHLPDARAAQRAERQLVDGAGRSGGVPLLAQQSTDDHQGGGHLIDHEGADRDDGQRLGREQRRRRLQQHQGVRRHDAWRT